MRDATAAKAFVSASRATTSDRLAPPDKKSILERAHHLQPHMIMNFRKALTLARHHGKASVVFCDGHVETPTLKFLFEDTSDAALVRWNRDHLPHRERLK